MEAGIGSTLFSSVNLAFFNSNNQYDATEVTDLLGHEPDLEQLASNPTVTRFRFVRDLKKYMGKGASGHIQKAYSYDINSLNRNTPLAVKRMHWRTIDDTDPATFYELYDREVFALRELCYGGNAHNSLARFYGSYYFKERDEHWLTFELCCGDLTFLRALPVKFDQLASIAAGTLAGLEAIHNKGFIHGDIKPHNLLLAPPGIVKICDFGLSIFLNGKEEPDLHALGTPRYMSPEHMDMNIALDSNEYDINCFYNQKTDIWAFGIVLLELMLGVAPLHKLRKIKRGLFNHYVQGMLNRNNRSNESGLKDILVLKREYRTVMEKRGLLVKNDLSRLVKRCPVLSSFENEELVHLITKLRLDNEATSVEDPVPNCGLHGLYRMNLCLDFIAFCLLCDYRRRPSAALLKRHPFVRATSAQYEKLLPNIQNIQVEYQSFSGRKKVWQQYPATSAIKPLYELVIHRQKKDQQIVSNVGFTSKFNKTRALQAEVEKTL